MKKQKSIGNKGFSLVELIIVIAIMAILVGVMAPQLLRYVERTRVSSDTQLADSVRTAVRTAMMDPVVLNDAASRTEIANITASNNSQGSAMPLATLASSTTEFAASVAETLGVAVADLGDVNLELSSTPNPGAGGGATPTLSISFWIINGNDVGVVVNNSDQDGDATTTDPIVIQ